MICNLTNLQVGNTKVKFILRMIEKTHLGFETYWKVGPDPDPNKIIQDCEQIFLLCVLQKKLLWRRKIKDSVLSDSCEVSLYPNEPIGIR